MWTPSRRTLLRGTAGAAAVALTGALSSSAQAATNPPRQVFGPFGSPARRLNAQTLYVDPTGLGDHTTVQSAVSAVPGDGWTIVLAAATYRETVAITTRQTGLTLLGASGDPRNTVIVFGNAAGTEKPDGSGTFGTTGSATVAAQANRFTARDITFANDWLRAEHPGVSGTQAVAIKVSGDQSVFDRCRFLGHQDTLYADSIALNTLARMYFSGCYVEGDVDFIFGRARAVFEHCHIHTLNRTDLAGAPYGFVFAPSTARTNPYGYLANECRITSAAPQGFFKLARPWVPSSDLTAWPSLTVRNTWLGPGIDAVAPYTNMSGTFPWQSMRFHEFANTGPGSVTSVPDNRPQLTTGEAAQEYNRETFLAGWQPLTRSSGG